MQCRCGVCSAVCGVCSAVCGVCSAVWCMILRGIGGNGRREKERGREEMERKCSRVGCLLSKGSSSSSKSLHSHCDQTQLPNTQCST
jgi:hypothetical protein